MSWSRVFFILLRLQVLRSVNRMQALRGYSAWTMTLGTVILLLSLIGMHLVLWTSLHRLLDADDVRQVLQMRTPGWWDPVRFTRYEDVPDQGARLMLVFLNSTLLSALFLKWGHWQSLQRDAEWEWFAERPWPAWPLFVQRCLVESIWPQSFSLFILPFFVLLGVIRGLHPLLALMVGLLIVLALQALLAAPRLSLDLCLRLRWPTAQVRAFRGIIGIFGAALMVFGMQCLSVEQSWAITAVMKYGSIWDHTPAALALSAVILCDHEAGLRHFFGLISLVSAVHGLCYVWAACALRRPMPRHGTWTGPARQRAYRWSAVQTFLWYRLHPLTRRDLSLLLRDRHFLLQVLVAPLVFAIIPQGLQTQNGPWLLAMAFGAGLLFLWAAVFHILPMEGRSLWMLFTWPQSLSQFLRRRLSVLLTLAGCYTSLMLALGFMRSGLTLSFEIWRLFYISWGLLCFATIMTAAAVFAYQPEDEGREQRPGILLNYGMLILGGIYCWFLFRPHWLESVLILIFLTSLAGHVWWRMAHILPSLLDRHAPRKKMLARAAYKRYFFRFITR